MYNDMKTSLSLITIVLSAVLSVTAQSITPGRDFVEVGGFNAYYARQGVAADDKHLFAIENNHITMFTHDGDSITTWHEPDKDIIRHINSGVVHRGKLYCSHSNFPKLPMASSVEIFDASTLRHIESVSLGIDVGSLVWVAPAKGCFYLFFANYDGGGGQPGHGVEWSQLVQYDDHWRRMQAWTVPDSLLSRIRPHSLSSGVLVDGIFYCLGHDRRECYMLRIPDKGTKLQWVGTIAVPIPGQAIAIGRDGTMWGIDRKQRRIIKARQQ